MTDRTVTTALNWEGLFAKSQAYINRALKGKREQALDEYQLWASLGLELLGKAALAKIHPSLIADPLHYESLFAASGINISTDVRTITAKTLFERLRRVVTSFDEKAKLFCDGLALRRNAELHSGENTLKTMKLEAWEAQYWHACSIILAHMGQSLETWLGAALSGPPKDIVKHAREARAQVVQVRIERHREEFAARKKADREGQLRLAETRHTYHYPGLLNLHGDNSWEARCPACSGKGFLNGIQVSEEVVETTADEDGAWESVETTYAAEEFACPVCDLHLDGEDEIEAAGFEAYHTETEQREMEFEMEYGND